MIRNCVICGKPFDCGYGRERGTKAQTCSPYHSRIYARTATLRWRATPQGHASYKAYRARPETKEISRKSAAQYRLRNPEKVRKALQEYEKRPEVREKRRRYAQSKHARILVQARRQRHQQILDAVREIERITGQPFLKPKEKSP